MSHSHGPSKSHECSERRGAGEGGTCHCADGAQALEPERRAPRGDYPAGKLARYTARLTGESETQRCAGAAAGCSACARLTERLRWGRRTYRPAVASRDKCVRAQWLAADPGHDDTRACDERRQRVSLERVERGKSAANMRWMLVRVPR